MDNISYFIDIMPEYLKDIFNSIDRDVIENITEIRLRKNKPLVIYVGKTPFFFKLGGNISARLPDNPINIDENSFNYITDRLCNYSYHTNMKSMVEGYLTVNHSSRIGIGSTAVYKDEKISSVKDISSINIRIAKAHKNCSLDILELLYSSHTPSIIVAGPPMSGKTTFLRDMARVLSSGFSGKYRKVTVVDERQEIAGGFDVGINTDVVTSFEKSKGIEIATRTLSPEIIICDEIGNIDELNAIKYGFSTGVSFAVSVHLLQRSDIGSNKILKGLIDTGEFDYVVLLKSFTQDYEIINIQEEEIENCRNGNDNTFYIFPWFNGE